MSYYAFILGRENLLSLAEIMRFFDGKIAAYSSDAAVIEADKISADDFHRLGGSIKVAEVMPYEQGQYEHVIRDIVAQKSTDKKLYFGMSVYRGEEKTDIKKLQEKIRELGMTLKQEIKNSGKSVRFVTSKGSQLSSVVVKKNRLISDQGVEAVVVAGKDKVWVGPTIAVQDFESFSFRDYQRPARDSFSGMLPPKLARVMLNLSGLAIDGETVVLDPFCGSGTVLQEAALLGAGKVLGSDQSSKAVRDTKSNIEWLKSNFKIKTDFVIEQVDVRELHSWLPEESVDLVVTEPFLGEPVRGGISKKEARQRLNELAELYDSALSEIAKVLKKQGRVVVLFPFIGPQRLPFPKAMSKFFEIIEIDKEKFTTERGGLDYKRPSQKVGREIFVLRKKL